MDVQVESRLRQSVSWKQYLSQDAAGDKIYATAAAVEQVLIVGSSRIIRDYNGEEKTSRMHLILGETAPKVVARDVIIVDEEEYPVLAVEHFMSLLSTNRSSSVVYL